MKTGTQVVQSYSRLTKWGHNSEAIQTGKRCNASIKETTAAQETLSPIASNFRHKREEPG